MQILAQKVQVDKKLVAAVNMLLKERREFVASIPPAMPSTSELRLLG